MSRKLGVFMLSLAVLMFAAASVFALDIVEGDTEEYPFIKTDVMTEGYNYRNVIIATLEEDKSDDNLGSREWGPVSWEIYPLTPGDNWLKFRFDSADNNVIYVEGVLPAYNSADGANNEHGYRFVAVVSGDVYNPAYETDDTQPEYIVALTSRDMECELSLEVEPNETSLDMFPDMVLVDTSAVNDIAVARKDNYSVTITFPMTTAVEIDEDTDDDDNVITVRTSTDIFANAVLEYTLDPEDPDSTPIDESLISLPSWLAYEVVETQHPGSYVDDDDGNLVPEYDDSTTYVKTLRIYYKADPVPEEEMPGTVRLVVEPASTAAITDNRDNGSANLSTTPFSELYENGTTIGWNVTFKPVCLTLSGDLAPNPLTVKWGESADAKVAFVDAMPATDFWTMSPDISADVSIKVDWTVADYSDKTEGLFTVKATPIAPASKDYTTTFFFRDSDDNVATAELTVKVTLPEPFEAETSPDTHLDTPLLLNVGESKDVVFTAKNFAGNVSWTVISNDSVKFEPKTGAGYATRYNEVAVYTVTALKETGSALMYMVFASDDAGRVDEDNLYIAVPFSFVVEPSAQAVKVTAGGASKTVSFTASGDNVAGVTWTVGTTPEGITVESDGSGNFTVTATSAAAVEISTVNITATNAEGKTAEAGIVINVLKPVAITVSDGEIPASGLVTYAYDGPSSYTLTADSSSAKWSITGENIAKIITPLEGTGSEFKFTLNPAPDAGGTYTATVNVEDEESGATGSYTFTVTVKSYIVLSYDVDTISIDYGSSKDIRVLYDYQDAVLVSFDNDDISADVAISYDIRPMYTMDGIPHGAIVVNFRPITPAETVYTTEMTVTDSEGYEVSLPLTISVDVGDLTVTPESADLLLAVGESGDVVFMATVFSGAVSWDLGTVPDGITVTEGNGAGYATEYNNVVAYTVTAVTAGSYSFNVKATDDRDETATATVYVTVSDTPIPEIEISPVSASITVAAGLSDSVTFTATKHSGDVSWTLGTVPSGITVAPEAVQTGASVTYTVTGVTAGTYSVDVVASDDTSAKHVTINATITEAGSLTVTPSTASVTLKAGGSSETVRFSAVNNSGDVTWTAGTAPAGVTVTSNGDGSFTVSAASTATSGDYSVTVTATDAAGRTATATISITVPPTPGQFTITASTSTLSVVAGNSDTVSFTARNNSGDVRSWSAEVVSGTATGVTVTHTSGGSFTVTGNTAGSYSVRVTATDAAGRTATATVSVTVTDPATTLTVSPSTATVSVVVGNSENVSFTVSGNSGNVTWSASTMTGATVTSNGNGSFTVRGVTGGASGTVTVTATDSAGRIATAAISITVTPTPGQFTITASTSTLSVVAGNSDTVSFTARNNSGDVRSWSAEVVSGTATGVTVTHTSGGSFTVTGNTAGSYRVRVTATDAAGSTATATISITVTPNPTPVPHIDVNPRLNLTGTVQSTIRNSLRGRLGSLITDATLVVTLPSSSITDTTMQYVGSTTVYLPEIKVTEARIYVFGVSLDNLPTGYVLGWTPNIHEPSTGEYIEASNAENNAAFFDESGNEITKVPSSKYVNVAAYFEPDKVYAPLIDASSPTTSGDVRGVGGSSGGCSAGLGAMVSALAAAFFIGRKRS